MPETPTPKDAFEYLDRLRESGETNMFGARPYVENHFSIGAEAADKLVHAWMRTFDGVATVDVRVSNAQKAGLIDA